VQRIELGGASESEVKAFTFATAHYCTLLLHYCYTTATVSTKILSVVCTFRTYKLLYGRPFAASQLNGSLGRAQGKTRRRRRPDLNVAWGFYYVGF
jgi:hypothetical protein